MRVVSGLTAQELAQLAGVALTTWLRIENRERLPTIDTIERLAGALGVSASWLAFGPEGLEPFRPRRRRPPWPPDEPLPRLGTGRKIDRHRGLAQRLRQRRAELGLSLRELGARAQVSAQAVVHAEAGNTAPKVNTVESLAGALGVAAGWLAYAEALPVERTKQNRARKLGTKPRRTRPLADDRVQPTNKSP